MLSTHPVLSCSAAVTWEESLLHGEEVKTWAAMRRAGESIALAALRDFEEIRPLPEDRFRVLVLCGTGHNAGDAILAASRVLVQLPNATATVLLVYGREKLRSLTLKALEELEQAAAARCTMSSWSAEFAQNLAAESFNLCIEGVVGMQIRPPLREPAGALFELIKSMDIELRAAVDLPAGLGDESAPDGFEADFTYATGIAKAPLFLPGNTARTGRVRYLDLGFFDGGTPDSGNPRAVLLPSGLRSLCSLRGAATDKRSYGHVMLLGGSRTMPGALAMATMAAVRGGAGLVTALVPANLSSRLAVLAPEAMWVPLPIDGEGALYVEESLWVVRRASARATSMVIGPGMEVSRNSINLVSRLLRESNIPMVLDAGAICEESASAAASRSVNAAPVVFTPHMGEFQRLCGGSIGEDIEAVLMDFAKRTRSIVVLKGSITRICDGENIVYDTFGGPVLARGGSGDILAGLLGALIARRGADAFQSVCQAAMWHGLAAEHLARARGQQAVRTTEILDHLAPVLREL